MTLSIQQWKDTGLLPTAGLLAWNKNNPGVDTNGSVTDHSGNGRTLTQVTTPPILTANVINGKSGWLFDGSKNPLVSAGALTPKHIFILASSSEATFGDYRGLLGQRASTGVLVGNATTTKFDDLSGLFFSYYLKNNVGYGAGDQQAPMGGTFGLIELQIPAGLSMAAIRVGHPYSGLAGAQYNWRGHWVEQLIYDRNLTNEERARVALYYNLEYKAFSNFSLPLYFPSDDFIGIRRRRFYAEPPQMSKITDSFEFEDGGKTFNESGSSAPRRWEYNYILTNPNGATDPPQVKIFDEFYETVRLSQAFNFTDKYGVTWDNVRIENYDRDHATYKPWRQEIKFKLVRYPK